MSSELSELSESLESKRDAGELKGKLVAVGWPGVAEWARERVEWWWWWEDDAREAETAAAVAARFVDEGGAEMPEREWVGWWWWWWRARPRVGE